MKLDGKQGHLSSCTKNDFLPFSTKIEVAYITWFRKLRLFLSPKKLCYVSKPCNYLTRPLTTFTKPNILTYWIRNISIGFFCIWQEKKKNCLIICNYKIFPLARISMDIKVFLSLDTWFRRQFFRSWLKKLENDLFGLVLNFSLGKYLRQSLFYRIFDDIICPMSKFLHRDNLIIGKCLQIKETFYNMPLRP